MSTDRDALLRVRQLRERQSVELWLAVKDMADAVTLNEHHDSYAVRGDLYREMMRRHRALDPANGVYEDQLATLTRELAGAMAALENLGGPGDVDVMALAKVVSDWKQRAITAEQQLATLTRERDEARASFSALERAAKLSTQTYLDDAAAAESVLAALKARAEGLREACEPFLAHYEPWMDSPPSHREMSTFARVTYGDLRRLRDEARK